MAKTRSYLVTWGTCGYIEEASTIESARKLASVKLGVSGRSLKVRRASAQDIATFEQPRMLGSARRRRSA